MPFYYSLHNFISFQIGRFKFRERYQASFLAAKIRAPGIRLAVTKVMYCGDLLRVDDELS